MAIGWLTPYARRKLLDDSTGVAAWTYPAIVYLGFTTSVIPDDASLLPVGVECTGNGYVRTAITLSASTMNAADASGQATNKTLITCFTASANWTVPGLGWFTSDAASGGNILSAGAMDGLPDPKPVLPNLGQIVTFPPDAFVRRFIAS